MCLEIDPKAEDQEKKHQQCIYESFRSRPFEEIVARSEANVIYGHFCFYVVTTLRIILFVHVQPGWLMSIFNQLLIQLTVTPCDFFSDPKASK